MAGYIQATRTLLRQIRNVSLPSDHELSEAERVLAQSPVARYDSFKTEEVRLVAAYRSKVSAGAFDTFWRSIVEGDWDAWIYAIHEAAELQAFADRGLDPFQDVEHKQGLPESHLRAILTELRFLRDWAEQIGFSVPESAIEIRNPIRGLLSRRHSHLTVGLLSAQNWSFPTEEELERAQRFWQQIRKGTR